MLKCYDSVIKPIFCIGSTPLYDALLSSKYDQLEEKGTDLAESHARTTIVLYYKVKWLRVTTAGNNSLYSFAKWSDNISTQIFIKIPKNSAFPST